MLLIPAIDLKDGECVRLRQGVMEDATVFSGDIVAMAKRWVDQGARRLHMVDLNGAFDGKPVNDKAVYQVREAYPDLPIQIGGGIRDLETIEAYLKAGVSYCIIGTKAVHNPEFVAEACKAFPGHIMVGLDAKDGMVAINGWAEVTDYEVKALAKQFENDGVEAIIYTDIGRDGMMQGVNVEATQALAQAVNIPIIASGGITNLDDIRNLSEIEADGVTGAITGRAIYEGTLDFKEGQTLSDQLAPKG
ncbi:1-(5-phosphoribosyl)-5-[(5-phosphoribosylamino)methylideneamino]imidazole-4-carboxamide isomerase [Thiomicrorhabdus sp. 6S2-11]|jgi:phosphoribosylformimino-5-aminoimidazole carboxamide ribotide isomerase|uniref:1-(5-phosphoribosyl)-5-[(5-phosphoribosylamino)methylideneamino] imidazole-4-carboxamide isomerase n=1 Tax=Thiomicrorhabdus marina TaxID=2818442 RepID=A0ABS3Q348_9GAMM|nr:1-(5-phosphoribosyl)-5-[(5-phosphoribosylamino)methylideneamino]imidazole-4-carboxamide isomerase [Thiomicrorhabdus marina]MBO1926528.1 1-(5-phosphoribosyl)-5-[(5-phosphoribosylamino)methylideneamino]imidazole-4-carboxamide isomerase [Thiomicrorhabdus marina]